MSRAALLGVLLGLTGCINLLDGVACATDADCLDYFCTEGACRAPPDTCPGGTGTYCGGDGIPGDSHNLYSCSDKFDSQGNPSGVDFALEQTCVAGCDSRGGSDSCSTR